MGFCCSRNNIPQELELNNNYVKKINNDNVEIVPIKDDEIKDIDKSLSFEAKEYAIWIDSAIFNDDNESYYDYFIKENIIIERFENIDDGFAYLYKIKNDYKNIKIIISGKLFNDFYYLIKKNINSINFSPTIIIFCNKIDLLINQLKMNNIYYFNDLFDTRFIYNEPSKIVDFINNNLHEETDLTFDIIDNLEQLIIPNYYPLLLDDVTIAEIEYFNNYLIDNFSPKKENNIDIAGNKEIHDLIFQIKNKKIPKKLLIKFWLRIYTLQSEFFSTMNKSLRLKNEESNFYYPFIRLCYEGIKKGFFDSYYEEIYRCSKISKEEFSEICIRYKSNKNKNNLFPSIIVFTRSFLSFSKDRKAINIFKGSDNDSYCILYVIEEIKNIDNIDKKVSNVDLEKYSKFLEEKEILIFPYSCFGIVDIKEIKNKGIDYEIKLKYLGYYSKYIEKQFGKNFFDEIQISNFSEDLIESGLIKIKNFFSSWIEKKNIKIKLDKICFFLDGEEDFIGFFKNNIYIVNIYLSKLKQVITIHNEQIINIIKLTKNRICSFCEDKTIQIIKILQNNEKYQPIKTIESYANKIKFLNNEIILYINENNIFKIYNLENESNDSREIFKENDKILNMEKINNDRVVYLSEDEKLNKIIKFINIKEWKKEDKQKKIHEDDNQKLIYIDLLIFNDYILVAFNWRIDIINYKDKNLNIKSFKYFDFEIKQIITLSSNRIILGFDYSGKESIIREHLLRIKDLENDTNQFDCIGQGSVKHKKVENIIKINESQILINIRHNSCLIYERKNEVSEKLKKSLIAMGKIEKEENKIKNPSENLKNNNSLKNEIIQQKNDPLNIKNKCDNYEKQNNPYFNLKTVENKKINDNINKINDENIQNKYEKTEANKFSNKIEEQILKDLPEAYNSKKFEGNSKNYNKKYSKINYA